MPFRSSVVTRQFEIDLDGGADVLCTGLDLESPTALWLDGRAPEGDGWTTGALVAIEPQLILALGGRDDAERPLEQLQRLLVERRRGGGTAQTGLAVLMGYGLLDEPACSRRNDDGLPSMVVLSVDRSASPTSDRVAVVTVRGQHGERGNDRERRIIEGALEKGMRETGEGPDALRRVGAPRTSLPRSRYLAAVGRVRHHIARGDIYQANLCQRFHVGYEGRPLSLYRRLVRDSPAPMSAYLRAPGLALCSVSPEVFLRLRPPDRIETFPIKGTRPRGDSPAEDRALAGALVESAKDRAELLMIVDLERNDLGRVCRTGSVETIDVAALRSFARVHHLVGHVTGRLRAGTDTATLLRATFPGGSITGAPKIRAMQILRELEPVRRNFFTGTLAWFGDDGSLDSSILIRSWVLSASRGYLGAGGGVVADSDPEQEWLESNLKARALARELDFDPAEAR